MVAAGKKFAPGAPTPSYQEYGGMTKIGEVIGVSLTFVDGFGSLAFYRNRVRNLT
jgi:hypothetical protein